MDDQRVSTADEVREKAEYVKQGIELIRQEKKEKAWEYILDETLSEEGYEFLLNALSREVVSEIGATQSSNLTHDTQVSVSGDVNISDRDGGIDMVIKKGDDWLVFIELKFNSGESDKQTKKYGEADRIKYDGEWIDKSKYNCYYFYLNKYRDPQISSSRFNPVTWYDIGEELQSHSSTISNVLISMVDEYASPESVSCLRERAEEELRIRHVPEEWGPEFKIKSKEDYTWIGRDTDVPIASLHMEYFDIPHNGGELCMLLDIETNKSSQTVDKNDLNEIVKRIKEDDKIERELKARDIDFKMKSKTPRRVTVAKKMYQCENGGENCFKTISSAFDEFYPLYQRAEEVVGEIEK